MGYNYYKGCTEVEFVEGEDRDALIQRTLKFVMQRAHIYWRMNNYQVDIDDLISAGNMGLITAASKYNKDKGLKFTTYAVHHIDRRIKNFIADDKNIIIPYVQKKRLKVINNIINTHSQSFGKTPSKHDIEQASGYTNRMIKMAMKHNVSDDKVTFDTNEFNEMISQENYVFTNSIDKSKCYDSPIDIKIKQEELHELYDMLNTLNDKDKDLIIKRFIDGKKIIDIAAERNQTPANITIRVGKVLNILKEKYKQKGVVDAY